MPLEVMEWESQAAFESWLHEFPRRFEQHSPDLLFEMYQSGELPDSDDLWEWAQFWADYTRGRYGNIAGAYNHSKGKGWY